MTSITFPDTGDTYSDDGSSSRDMQNGGHRRWLLEMLRNLIAYQSGSLAVASQQAVAADKASVASMRAAIEAAQAGITVGSTQSLAYPAVVQNLVTASDVVAACVYDTRQDSDGGAWTEQCRNTSWYQEALNIAGLRGARRAFPRVAILLLRATAPCTLLVHDALDLDPVTGVPRLWRAWGGVAGALLDGTGTAVFALHGRLWVCTSTGLHTLDLPGDRATRRDGTDLRGWSAGLASAGTYAFANASGAIGAAAAASVHARVLPGAPLDPASGLPIPTTLVGTGAGAAVIHASGFVAQITRGGGFARGVIVHDNRIWLSAGSGPLLATGPMPYAASLADTGWRQGVYTNTSSIVQPAGATTFAGMAPGVVGSTTTTFLAEDEINPDAGMVAYVRTFFATGWLPGDARLAILNDSAIGGIAGATPFADDGASATAWTLGTGWTHDAGSTEFDHAAGSTAPLDLAISGLTSGSDYLLRLTVANVTAGSLSVNLLGTNGETGDLTITASGEALVQFTASAASETLRLTPSSAFDGSVGGVQIDLAVPDRSKTGKGLSIVGTLTRTPVEAGAELACWSGWSASNYLERRLNPAEVKFLVFWFKGSDFTGAFQCASDVSNPRISMTSVSNRPRLALIGTGGSVTVDSLSMLNTGGWACVVGVLRGDALEVWVNGRLEATGSAAGIGSMANTAAVLRIGRNVTNAAASNGAFALLRIGATAPSPAQIARLYRDERALFEPGAACTIGGTFNTVNAAAWSETSRQHAIATLGGVSVFAGLRRVEFLDSVSGGAAIASSNVRGLAMEGGVMALATTANGGVRREAILGLDRMPAAPVLSGRRRVLRASGVTTDATPLILSPRILIGERETMVVRARILGRVAGASDTERLTYERRATYHRPAGGDVAAPAVQSLGTDTETTAGADATLVRDTASQTGAVQVTGVAGTRIAWSAELEVLRLSEITQYEDVA
ncbi:LamG domain-containing protein [Falsiroseomonas selenitidurans]|uniref:LamG domain-containing protein n=1 Tax=Falsiroseomonas selenitidurans TaxID=2716335 RepID=A0ABX1DZ75_9PROT|nr:LamG domain-containing protein [Falsiroseomonas selenitidurans]NKC30209.1 LamG domain-containing protein [Falsiroseomonas selenitidurans]